MLRKVARLLACAAVGVAMLCMRPTAALAEDVDFTCRGTREITSTYYTKEQMIAQLPTTQSGITGLGNVLYPFALNYDFGTSTNANNLTTYLNTWTGTPGNFNFDFVWPYDWDYTDSAINTNGTDYPSQYDNFAPMPPTGTGRMFCKVLAVSTSNFPAGRYFVSHSSNLVRVNAGTGRVSVWNHDSSGAGRPFMFMYCNENMNGLTVNIHRNVMAWWNGSQWTEMEHDDDGFYILPEGSIAIAWCFETASINWGTAVDLGNGRWDCIPMFRLEAMWSSDSVITVLNGNDGSTVTGTINSQTDTLMDTTGSDGIVGAVTQGGVSGLTSRLGFIAQIPTVVSSFLAGISSGTASGGLFFPGVTVLGYTLIPAQDVPVWQNGLAALETPIKAFNTGVLALLFVKGAKHVFHKDLLGWDDDEGGSE